LNPDGQIKNIGDPFKNLKLAETFKKLSNNKNAFYESPLAEQISLDIIEAGGIVTVEDIKNYETRESEE
jgi:gamma-glutamyltranspeptidase